ncbi:hypothetical protein HKCCE2091_21035 [Rhodobacterales bacterium HKCCE2091]|nr:hypothetical protein [Rhodobacterales bacterium HKCCE2091]
MRTAFVILAALAAAPASALVPPPCEWVEGSLSLGEWGADHGTGPAVWPEPVGADFVRWTVHSNDAAQAPRYVGLQHCPTGQEILLGLSPAQAEAQLAQFDALMTSSDQYTLRQIGEEMAAAGASARVSRNGLGDCACDLLLGAG